MSHRTSHNKAEQAPATTLPLKQGQWQPDGAKSVCRVHMYTPGSFAAAPPWAGQLPPCQALALACHWSTGSEGPALQHATPAGSQQLMNGSFVTTQHPDSIPQYYSTARMCENWS